MDRFKEPDTRLPKIVGFCYECNQEIYAGDAISYFEVGDDVTVHTDHCEERFLLHILTRGTASTEGDLE